jgi:hypothetical protein
MKKLSVVVCTFVWILSGIIFIVIMVIHIHISHWRWDDRPQVCIAYSVTIDVSGFGKCGSLVIVCIFAWILQENIVYCFICDNLFHDFNIFWLLVFQMLRFYLHWWDINCQNGHMQNLNFLQFRYFVIFVSMDWETECHSRYFCMDIHIFISG